MTRNFYAVENKIVDEKIMIYLRSKKRTLEIYNFQLQSDNFNEAARKTVDYYFDLIKQLGVKAPYVKVNNVVCRSVSIERSSGRSILSTHDKHEVNCQGVTKISESEYIQCRQEIMHNLGLLPKALEHFHKPKPCI